MQLWIPNPSKGLWQASHISFLPTVQWQIWEGLYQILGCQNHCHFSHPLPIQTHWRHLSAQDQHFSMRGGGLGYGSTKALETFLHRSPWKPCPQTPCVLKADMENLQQKTQSPPVKATKRDKQGFCMGEESEKKWNLHQPADEALQLHTQFFCGQDTKLCAETSGFGVFCSQYHSSPGCCTGTMTAHACTWKFLGAPHQGPNLASKEQTKQAGTQRREPTREQQVLSLSICNDITTL